jgi:hypothetical protein
MSRDRLPNRSREQLADLDELDPSPSPGKRTLTDGLVEPTPIPTVARVEAQEERASGASSSPGTAFLPGHAPTDSMLASGAIRRAARADWLPRPGDEEAVARAQATSGQPLPASLRDSFGRAVGADLSGVRVHDNASSAAAADALAARAFTTGQDIHFGAGEYAPSSPEGARLLAHEVAHTVQGAPASTGRLEVSSPADPAELEADAAAARIVRGEPTALGGGASATVHRHPVNDHKAAGDAGAARAGVGTVAYFMHGGARVELTMGDFAMFADYFGSPERLLDIQTPNVPEGSGGGGGAPGGDSCEDKAQPAPKDITASLSVDSRNRVCCMFASNRAHGMTLADFPCEPSTPEVRKQVQAAVDREFTLQFGTNQTHFSGQARDQYEQKHRDAIYLAFSAGYANGGPETGLAIEGIGHHYLQDLFSAGHVRVPAQEITEEYAKPPYSEAMRLLGSYAARCIGGLVGLVDSDIGKYGALFQSVAFPGFDLGDLVRGAFHNADCLEGVEVVSDRDPSGAAGPFHWKVDGETGLKTPFAALTKQMMEKAVEESTREVRAAWSAGVASSPMPVSQIECMAIAAAQSCAVAARGFIPRAEKEPDKTMWQWGSLDPKLRDQFNGLAISILGSRIPATVAIPVFGTIDLKPVRNAFTKDPYSFVDAALRGGPPMVEANEQAYKHVPGLFDKPDESKVQPGTLDPDLWSMTTVQLVGVLDEKQDQGRRDRARDVLRTRSVRLTLSRIPLTPHNSWYTVRVQIAGRTAPEPCNGEPQRAFTFTVPFPVDLADAKAPIKWAALGKYEVAPDTYEDELGSGSMPFPYADSPPGSGTLAVTVTLP